MQDPLGHGRHPAGGARPSHRPRLLLVQRSVPDFDLIAATLRRDGIDATCQRVDDLARLQQALAAGPWDAVLTEHPAPGFPGLPASTVLRLVRGTQPHCPVLIVADALGDETAVGALRRGFADVLSRQRLARLAPALLNAMSAARTRAAEAPAADDVARLRGLLAASDQAIEAERREVARELHDDMASALMALRLDLAWIADHGHGDPARAAARARQATQAVDQLQQTAARLQQRLHPAVLDHGLVQAVDALCDALAARSGVSIRCVHDVDFVPLDESVALTVYRIVQEALTNAVRHGSPSRIDVDLSRGTDALSIEIVDDGSGLNPGAGPMSGGRGLAGMRERAARHGGRVDVTSGAAGRGTIVLLSLPLPAAGTVAATG